MSSRRWTGPLGLATAVVCAYGVPALAGDLVVDRVKPCGRFVLTPYIPFPDDITDAIRQFTRQGDAAAVFLEGQVHTAHAGSSFAPQGNLVVPQEFQDLLLVVSPTGELVQTISGGGLDGPKGTAITPMGDIVVGSFFTDSIKFFTTDGTYLSNFTHAGTQDPNALAYDRSDNLYVASRNSGNLRIAKYDADLNFVQYIGEGQLGSNPLDIAFDKSQRLYVTTNTGVKKFTTSGTLLLTIAHEGLVPGGIAFDETEKLYVTNATAHDVYVFATDGTFIESFEVDLGAAPANYQLQGIVFQALPSHDCNTNNVEDTCDIDEAGGPDCNVNGVPDPCDLVGYLDVNFSPPTTVSVGDAPEAVIAADLDGINGPDLVTANNTSNNVSALLNDGTGGFSAAVSYAAGTAPKGVTVADFDGLNGPDLAVANNGDNTISVLLNNGDGTFASAVSYSSTAGPRGIAAADLDGVNGPDLVTANESSDTVRVYLNQGDGTFAAGIVYEAGIAPRAVAIGDLDGVNGPDLAIANGLSDDVSILLNNGDGTFAAPQNYNVGDGPQAIAMSDLDGSSGLDVAVVCTSANQVAVLLNDGGGMLGPADLFFVGSSPRAIAAAQLNAAGGTDLAVARFNGDDLRVLANRGFGAFKLAGIFEAGDGAHGIVMADLNGDGLVDAAVANRNADTVTIHPGEPGTPVSGDCNTDGTPDDCQADCNTNGAADVCDIADGGSQDCDSNGSPDECSGDCNENGVADECELTEADCNTNGVVDECEFSSENFALSFASDFVHVPNSNALSITSSMTVELWATIDTPGQGTFHHFVFKGSDAQGFDPIFMRAKNNQLDFGFTYTATQFSLVSAPIGSYDWSEFHHIAGVFDDSGDQLRLYIDGVLVGTAATTAAPQEDQSGLDLWLGSTQSGEYLQGDMDEIRIWNIPRTGDEILARMDEYLTGTEPGLVAYWRLDEGAGQAINDSSPYSHVGTRGSTAGPDSFDPAWIESAAPVQTFDCNGNGVHDACDIAEGESTDCNGNGLPDACEPGGDGDCDTNGVPDACDLLSDCNTNGSLDVCDIANGGSEDCNGNGLPDECSGDCNNNDVFDDCELADFDCNTNSVVDECEFSAENFALDFAASDYVRVTSTDDLSMTSSLTLEMWAQADNPGGGWQVLLSKGDTQPGLDPYYVRMSSNDVEFTIVNDGNQAASLFADISSYDSSVAHHIAGVFDDAANELRLSIDGTLVASAATTLTPLTNQATMDVWIGSLTQDQFFDGELDEIRIWNVPRTAEEISEFMGHYLTGTEPGLVAYWRLDEGSGQMVEDSSPNDHVGTLGSSSGTDSFDPTWVTSQAPIAPEDCNTNGTFDACDISEGGSTDCDNSGVPDECEAPVDCNSNGLSDACDIDNGVSLDCNSNSQPDECDAPDCNGNAVPDACELATNDCNTNGSPDDCDSPDCNTNAVPDECDVAEGQTDDDGDIVPDSCDNCLGLNNPDQDDWLLRTIEGGNAGQYGSLRLDGAGIATLSYYDVNETGLKLWHDDNADLAADDAEIRTIDSMGNVGQYTSLAFDSIGRATIAYHNAGSGDLELWFDADADLTAGTAELHTIDTAGDQGEYASLAFNPAGRAVVAYYDNTDKDLRLWYDFDGDFSFDIGEITVIHSAGNVGQYASLAFDGAGLATIAYHDVTNMDLRIWHDANGNYLFDTGERVGIDTAGDQGKYARLAFDAGGHATVAYFDGTADDLRLWHDANGNFAFDFGEIVVIDSSGAVGQHVSLTFDSQGRALAAYYRADTGNLRLWFDADGDFSVDDGETAAAQTAGNVGTHTSIVFDAGVYAPLIAYRDETQDAMMLTAHLDWDGDETCFIEDNCTAISNPDQLDSDDDGDGDACDGDDDNDGVPDEIDPCPLRKPGDVNGDGALDAADASAMAELLLDPDAGTPDDLCAADMDGSGGVDGDDVDEFVAALIGG